MDEFSITYASTREDPMPPTLTIRGLSRPEAMAALVAVLRSGRPVERVTLPARMPFESSKAHTCGC